jgi:putative colanic acid biosynthesis acetyltransferase WcaF
MPKYYTKREILQRIVWGLVEPIFFSYTPRLCYSWRNFILKTMGAKIGVGVKIYPSAKIMYPWLLQIGDRTTISWQVKIYNLAFSTIGSDTMISQYSHLCGGTHDFRSKDFDLIRTGFTIGNKVWIAADAFIGPKVNIADNAVVGARAVVMKNVAPGSIVAGNPAKVIGMV